jgi:hypothetical protein
VDESLKTFIDNMDINPPTTEYKLCEAELNIGISFPTQYKEFMLASNGAEGGIGEHSYLVIWPIEEIVKLNEQYAVSRFTPGLVYFGFDGGGMAYAFDNRTEESSIVEFPFESIKTEDIKQLGRTFHEFLRFLFYLD